MAKKKSKIEIYFFPLVIAGAAILSAHSIMQQQENNAKSRADSDNSIKMIQIVNEYIRSGEEEKIELALTMLNVFDSDKVKEIVLALSQAAPDNPNFARLYNKFVDKYTPPLRQFILRIFMRVQNSSDKNEIQAVKKELEKNNWLVPEILIVGVAPPHSSQLRYFRKSERSMAKTIHSSLTNMNLDISLIYIPGFEETKELQPLYFEIWFAH